MPVPTAAQPEPVRPSGPDLALVEALQRDPRAPWTRIAAAVGTDATTAAPTSSGASDADYNPSTSAAVEPVRLSTATLPTTPATATASSHATSK